ncbi:MAG: hypothetical protein IJD16_09160 [Desulfovibrio sp.]|nr:hypothetical protein [Desulfovibrio sp.]
MIQTSYFSSKAPRERKVSIAKWPPRNWKGPQANQLAPTDPRASDWAAAYRRDLLIRFPMPSDLRRYLEEWESKVPDPIFCCYEADANQCHRRVLAAFIQEQLNWHVPEWGSSRQQQASLF